MCKSYLQYIALGGRQLFSHGFGVRERKQKQQNKKKNFDTQGNWLETKMQVSLKVRAADSLEVLKVTEEVVFSVWKLKLQ